MISRRTLMFALMACRLWAQNQPEPAPVHLDGRVVLNLYSSVGNATAQERAVLAERRIHEIAASRTIAVESIQTREGASSTDLFAGDRFLVAVTDADAAVSGRPRAEVAAEYASQLRQHVQTYRQNWSWQHLLRGAAFAALATLVFGLLFQLLGKAYRAFRTRVFERRRANQGAIRLHRAELISASRSAALLLTAASILRWTLVLVLLEVYLPIVLGLFPGTAGYAAAIRGWIWAPVVFVWESFFNFLPNLFFILVISVATYYIVRLSDFIFDEIAKGRITFDGFYPDWAGPTSRLVRVMILMLAIVVVFPYLPGSKSPAFQGVSIFVGILLSLGSTSAVSNAVAGTILTYMRPFQLGDRVRISELVGDVVEKNLLVTRLQTIKNEVITIPNANILNGQIWNFSTTARQKALILHTSLTIGYDAPWRTVHQLLINAAAATRDILEEPKPFVLQTALNDFYVTYELNAYTDCASRMVAIYSELHQNIQDQFNEAGVEIMSPHFSQIRDGNTIAIPEQYRPPEYEPPAMRVEQVTPRVSAQHS